MAINWDDIKHKFSPERYAEIKLEARAAISTMEMHNPPHPGAVLKDAIEGIPMTVSEFAAHIGVSRNTLSRILNERAAITAEMSMRLSEAFGQPTSDIWFRMQNKYDFWKEEIYGI